ncbi:hypothetical protein HW132_06890 [Brasilonema sp. CT11]|nr:hypothetical protein [Brasilonema sp. CT11]
MCFAPAFGDAPFGSQALAGDGEVHLITLNRYRYSEQRSCKDLSEIHKH